MKGAGQEASPVRRRPATGDGHEDDVVAGLEEAEHDVVEVGRRVHHDVLAERLEDPDDLHHLRRPDLVGEGRLHRGRQHVEPGDVVPHEEALQQRGVESVDGGDGTKATTFSYRRIK